MPPSDEKPDNSKAKPEAARIEEEKKAGLPVAEVDAPEEHDVNEEAPKLDAYKGRWTNKKDGLIYALAVTEDNVRGRTHHARNTARYWNGTEVEFKDQFEKA